MNSAIYRARRERLLDQIASQGGGVAIVRTAPEVPRNRDSDYPYRHDSYFYYLSGFSEPEAVLVLDSRTRTSTLFCRAKDETREIWDGYRYGPDAAREAFGFEQAFAIDTLDAHVPKMLADAPAVYYALGTSTALDRQIRHWLAAVRQQNRAGVRAPAAAYDVNALLDEMRLVKDAHELDVMRRAGAISARAHVRAMQASHPGVREYELEAELLYEFRRHGSQFPAYGSIVAGGANACVLHYRAGDTACRDGELCLIDAACELDGYASDITRTFPINGRFSGPQRELYDLVLAAQQAAIDATRAGVRFDVPHEAAVRVLSQGMLDTGLLKRDAHGSVDDVIASKAYTRFYMHRTGHWIGMDVHDCGEYREATPLDGERPWRTLQSNMVLTVEPGIYVRAADDIDERFWNIGIRIEDDAVVTDDGCELITRGVPVDAGEIEALMRH